MAASNSNALLAEARNAYQAGDRARMRELIKEALAADPGNIEVWLLATYATDNPAQQRQFLDRAKQIKRVDARILLREKELFPDVDNGITWEPDVPASTPLSNPQPSVASSSSSSTTRTQVPPSVPTDHIPTLADGVKPKATRRLIVFVPALAVVVIIVLGIGLMALSQSRLSQAPSAIVLRFYPALQAGDNATLLTLFTADVAALCNNKFALCFPIPTDDFQGYSIAGETLTGQNASVVLRIQSRSGRPDLCQTFPLTNTDQGWKMQKAIGVTLPCQSQAALLPSANPATVSPSLPASTSQPTLTLDATQLGVVETSTMLAETQNAMLQGPTLTATYLAPGYTQTALVGEQNRLNAALASTQTQAVAAVTQTAAYGGITTGTPLAIAHTKASATQAAALFKTSLKGKLVAARKIQGQTQLVTLNADGSNLSSLNVSGIDPIWSPDGQRIAYTNQVGVASIHIMGANGSNDKELPAKDAPFGSNWSSWSPDGRQIMFEAGTRMGLHALWKSPLDGTNISELIDDSHTGGWNSWSPDGKAVVYTKDDQVWVYTIATNTPRSIAKQAGARTAAWSPDGQYIAFDAGDDSDRGLYLMNADGSGLHRLTSKTSYVRFPAWSPDGKNLAALCYDSPTNQ